MSKRKTGRRRQWKPLRDGYELFPKVLPPEWSCRAMNADGAAYVDISGLTVICSAARERDGRRWLHVSLARRSDLPSWEDFREVKDLFIGPERRAIQVLPPENEYVNENPFCLHLWACLDDDGLPDFRKRGTL